MVFHALFCAALFDSKTPRRNASEFSRKISFKVPSSTNAEQQRLNLEHCGRGEQIMPPPQAVLTTERLKLSCFSK
jgi:hypothetical protein